MVATKINTYMHPLVNDDSKQLASLTRVICIASGKGGVGKTNITINLAHTLVQQNLSVWIMDANLGLANVCVALGLQPSKNLSHVINGECNLEDIILQGPEGIEIIPASPGMAQMTALKLTEYVGIVSAFSAISNPPDVLLIDMPPGISFDVVNFCRAAHDVIVVISDEPTAFADACALLRAWNRDYSVGRSHLLVNRTNSDKHARDIYLRFLHLLENHIDITPNYLGFIPEDTKLKRAAKTQRTVLSAYPNSSSAQAFEALGKRLLLWPQPFGSGGLQFFFEQVIKSG